MPACSAIHPVWRPITSSTMMRSWLAAVVWRRSIASVAQATALSKPNVKAVAERSLSIDLGTPTTGMPCSWNCWATARDPSPPMQISPSMLSWCMVRSTSGRSSGSSSCRSSIPTRAENRPWLVDPRMVPPRLMIPDVFVVSRGT